MSRIKSFVRAASTLSILLTLNTVALAGEQTTGPPVAIKTGAETVVQVTYPEDPILITDKPSGLPVTDPLQTSLDTTASVYNETPMSNAGASEATVGEQAYTLDEAVIPPTLSAPTLPDNKPTALKVQRSNIVTNTISQELLPPVTASESYVDPATIAPPAPPVPPEEVVVAENDTSNNQTVSDTSATPTSEPSAPENPVTTPSVKKELPVISYQPTKIPALVTTNIVKYTAKAKDTLYILAQNFITTVKSIRFINNLKSDYLKIGQLLKIASNAPQNQSYKTKLDTYTVKTGDTLALIAKKYGTTEASIKTTNALTSNKLKLGQALQIPYVSALTSNGNLSVKYKISIGDSLKTIAENFETTVAAIKSLNGLKSDALFTGEYLQIPTSAAVANRILVAVPIQNYTIQPGDSLNFIAKQSSCTIAVIKLLNNLTSDALFSGNMIKVPEGSLLPVSGGIDLNRSSLSSRYQATQSEELLLARLIYGESRGEEYQGQVAVGAVVLNRTKSPDFPKTIGEVIYQQYEFSAVLDGQINLTPDATAMKAAAEALQGTDPTGGALFYWNPIKAPNNKFLNAKPIIKRIGDHVFAK
jgi:N-acetylmuramoyl-L-alanine amidase